MQTATGGVKNKIYGKQGRRIRAKERLENQLNLDKTIITKNSSRLDELEKKSKLTGEERYEYDDLLIKTARISDGLPRIKSELLTLNSRI